MMKIGPAVAAAAVFAIASPVCAQDAVQWRVEDGGNGHWYRLVLVPSGVTWQAASVLCTQSGGHLVSITSVGERDLIAYLTPQTPGNGASPVRGWGPWIGAFQEAGAAEPAGGWRWVTDESWDATFWSGGQPDNRCTETGQAENFLSIHNAQGLTWNDLPLNGCDNDPVIAYWIEFDADCNSDGIVDYGQIRDGTLPDLNANGVPDCCEPGESCTPCPGDVTNGGTVDAADLSILLAAWGTNGQGEFDTDLNGDGLVDGGDLALILGGWGACP